jgi:transcriptional regulator with XRE-family HTH domain
MPMKGRGNNKLRFLVMSTSKSQKKRGRRPKPVDKKSLGGRIRAARERLSWTTKELGERIGVSGVTITHIENGVTKNPDQPTLEALARELGDSFGQPWLKEYLNRLKYGTLIYDEGLRRIIERYNTMPPEIRKRGVELFDRLSGGEILDTGKYDGDEPDAGEGGKK